MKSTFVLACLSLLVGAHGALAQNASAKRGEALARERCGRCHAVTRTERSHHPQAPGFHRIALRYPPEQMEEALAEGITVGHPDMPEFAFTPAEVNDLVSHLRRLRRP